MINRIGFRNYKVFKEKQTLELKPITVVIGKNNSGKSVIAKLPTLIEGALNADSSDALYIINDGVELGGELRDLIYGKANRAIELEIEQSVTPSGREDKLFVEIIVTTEKSKQISKIIRWKINNSLDLHFTEDSDIYVDELTDDRVNCNFKGLRLVSSSSKSAQGNEIELEQNLKLRTDYIGPIRVKPQRDYRIPTAKNDKSGIDGENIYYSLIQDALSTEKKLINAVANWYKENFEGWELRINQDKAPIFQVEVQREELRQNILDTGIGMSQVLPIVTRALKSCDEETLIIIEEPETHLHPGAHGNLAQLFVDSLSQGKKKYLLETHSLNFVLRLRTLVADKKLAPDDLAIYYVDFVEEKNYSILKKIPVDEFGRVEDWPKGVFGETLTETIALRTAQLDNPTYGDRDNK